MTEKNEKKTVSARVNTVMEKNRKLLISLLVVLVVGLIGVIVYEIVSSKNKEKDLAAIDKISYELVNESSSLTDAELSERSEKAMAELEAYLGKGGIVGVKANNLAADLAYAKKDYEKALSYWTAVTEKGKKLYTYPIAKFNMASCLEELNRNEDAAAAYKECSEVVDFVLANHAKFNYGRVLEVMAKYEEAAEVYQQMNDDNPYDSWSNIAKTRLISLEADGKIKK